MGLNPCPEGPWGWMQPSSLQPLSALQWGLQCGVIAAGCSGCVGLWTALVPPLQQVLALKE